MELKCNYIPVSPNQTTLNPQNNILLDDDDDDGDDEVPCEFMLPCRDTAKGGTIQLVFSLEYIFCYYC